MNKLTLLFFLLLPCININVYGQDTIYIDPTNTEDPQQDGSINHPYDNWDELDLTDNTTYLFRCGTVLDRGSRIDLYSLNDVALGSYDMGDRPRINTNTIFIRSNRNLVIKNIDFYLDGGRGINFDNDYKSYGVRIDNCVIRGVEGSEPNYGIGGRADNLTIINTEVYNIYSDGMCFGGSYGIEIRGSYIHHVNQAYHNTPENSSGDGVQFINCDTILIKKTVIDRSGTGGKFNVIFTSTNDNFDVTHVVLEDNHFIGPGKYDQGGASMFIGIKTATVRRNKIEDALAGVYSHASDMTINNNLFINNKTGIRIASNGADIFNNVFYGNELGIHSWLRPSIVKNNVFYLTDTSAVALRAAGCEVDHNIQNISTMSNPLYEAEKIVDPMFVDAANHNFYLQENSPCIDNGEDVGIQYDYANNLIPCNGIPDIGAFEFQGNCESNSNHPPVADAGENQTVEESTQVDLDGSSSYDPDEDSLSFIWNSPGIVTLSDSTVPQTCFTAPEVESDTSLYFYLIVSDGKLTSSADTVKINIKDVTASAIESGSKQGSVMVFPNPTHGSLKIRSLFNHDLQDVRIKIYSLDGKLVSLQDMRNRWSGHGIINLSVDELLPGIYFLKIESAGKPIYHTKIIKQ